ncbi:MAG: ABC transporter substrate-binding protein [Pseudomonadota bacterium]
MKQFEVSTWVFSLLLAFLLAAQSAEAAQSVRFAVPQTPMSLPFYVAAERKFFEKYQVKPVLVECKSGRDCVQALGRNEADVASSSELPVMFAAFEDSPISVLATFASNKDNLKFLVSSSSLHNGKLDLAGKRIGYVPKSASHYYMDIFLLFKGIDPKQVIKVPMAVSELPKALSKGSVDAISIWEPWAEKILRQEGGDIALVPAPRLYTQTFNVSVRNEFKHSQTSAVHGVMKALDDAVNYIRDYPSRAQSTLLRHNLATQEYIESNWPVYTFRMTLQQSLVSTLQGQARWAKREGHVRSGVAREPEYLNYIDASFLREHKSDHVDFVYR